MIGLRNWKKAIRIDFRLNDSEFEKYKARLAEYEGTAANTVAIALLEAEPFHDGRSTEQVIAETSSIAFAIRHGVFPHHQARSHPVTIRVSKETYKHVRKHAAAHGLHISGYARKQILGTDLRELEWNEPVNERMRILLKQT